MIVVYMICVRDHLMFAMSPSRTITETGIASEERSPLIQLPALVEAIGRYGDLFVRTDHRHWFIAYLWGLINTPGRKTIEAIARSLPSELAIGSSPAQSLHHFLNQSAWDDENVLARLRELLDSHSEEDAAWVVHEVALPKRGKHSVGVRRQLDRRQGLKASSQTIIAIARVETAGYQPLAMRLYLPRGWLREASERQIAQIPEAHRDAVGKDQIAGRLLGELDRIKRPKSLVVPVEFSDSEKLMNWARKHGVSLQIEGARLRQAEVCELILKESLGLDHFEGRSWVGFHRHLACVSVACACLAAHSGLRIN